MFDRFKKSKTKELLLRPNTSAYTKSQDRMYLNNPSIFVSNRSNQPNNVDDSDFAIIVHNRPTYRDLRAFSTTAVVLFDVGVAHNVIFKGISDD